MKNKFVKALISVMTALALCTTPINAYAIDNIETMKYSDKEIFVNELCAAFTGNGRKTLNDFYDYFIDDVYIEVRNISKSLNLGSVLNVTTDYIKPQYSSNGDYVIMANTRIVNNSGTNVYILEFHFNSHGKIYGFNLWQY